MIRNRRPLVSTFISLSVVLVICSTADARRGAPPSSVTMKAGAIEKVRVLELDAVDRQKLQAEDEVRAAAGPGPLRFALPRDVEMTPSDSGTWEDLPDGGRLWRLRIHAPNATDLNFGFTRFRLAPGATLHIISEDDDFFQGPYTSDDNKAHGELWTPMVPGERAVIELYVPAGVEFEPELRLGRVGCGYRDLFKGGDDAAKRGSCNVNVVCPEGDAWRDQIRSVGRYTIDSQYLCTGSLVNDVPGSYTPYFLSASHCDVNSGNDQTVVVYWNHESDSCATFLDPNLSENQSGSIFRASDSLETGSDLLLLELEDQPDASFNVFFSGWDARDRTPSSTVCIHHPGGDEKSISFDNDPPTVTSYLGDSSPGDGDHFRVADWDVGTTEGGSSGACLFDEATGRCVGTLSGGFAACGNDDPDWFGRFSKHWDGSSSTSRLKDWLDPGNTGTMWVDGANPGGGGGGGGSWDCGNAGYDNDTTDTAAFFGGGLAGDPEYMFAVKFELADFGYQPGNVQITGFCAANQRDFGGPWPNEVFIYPDAGGLPDDSSVLGQGTIRTGDGAGPWVVTLASPVTLNGDFWLVNRGDPMWAGEDFNMEYDTVSNVGNSYISQSGISGLGLSNSGNYMLRATLQTGGGGGGGGGSDCGNAYYDNGTWEGTAWFGGSGAGNPDNMYGVKFELADFGFTPGNTQITGFCAGNHHAWTDGPWPNEVFIYADAGGSPNESAKLGQGTVYTGDGAPGQWYEVDLSSPVTLNGDFWVVMRGDPKWVGEDFNMDYDSAGSTQHSYGSSSGIGGISPASVGNYMLRAKLQEGGGGGGGTGDGAYNYFLAAIAHTPGVGTALWRSKLGVLNRSGSSAEVVFTYYWKNGPTTVKSTVVKRSIANGRLQAWDDAAVSLFGITSKSSGSVLVNSTKPLVVTARTYNVGQNGSFGSFMPGVTASNGVRSGEMGVLTQLTGNNDFRTNVGLVNLSNMSCQVRVRVVTSNGATVGTAVTKTLGAHKFTQINDVFGAAGAGSRNDAYATVEVLTSGCEVWAYGAVIDGTSSFPGTDDATTVPLTVVDQ